MVNQLPVLILILMEYSLRQSISNEKVYNQVVLILILMEYSLRPDDRKTRKRLIVLS